MNTNCLHTGGAVGADQYYEKLAKEHKHKIVLYHFDGYRNTRIERMEPPDYVGQHTLLEFTDDEKEICDVILEKAAKKLGRILPSNNAARHLLERDFLMVSVSKATSLYSIGSWEDRQNGIIKGGTGWIVEIFTLLNHNANVYFHCKENNINYKLCGKTWLPLEKVAEPSGVWIGCGSRH